MSALGIDGAQSVSGGSNSAQNYATGQSNSWSQTDAAAAREWSAKQAELAFERQKELNEAQMKFNREEAERARKWEADMANTVYTRSVKNMTEAGINPILAANMGLSGASVGSGATASISGSTAPMGQSFMDTSSASSGSSESYGESHGSQWGQSESGLAVGLQMLGEALGNAISTMNSGSTINNYMEGFGEQAKDSFNDFKKWLMNKLPSGVSEAMGLEYDASGSGVSRKKKVTGSTSIKGRNGNRSSGGGFK